MLLEWAGGSWILRRLYSVTAVGKLGVVLAEGRPPRPVVDSSVSGVTSITSLPNRSVNPTLADLFLSMPLSDSRERLVALILNVAKAHRRILIRACDRVLLCFRHRKKLYQYVTLNFGARVSSYYFALLESVSAPLWASLVAVLLVLKVPLSWRKAALSPQVVWIGWELKLDLSCFCVRLDPGKISRLCALLRDALRHAVNLAEMLFTLALAYVVLCVTTIKSPRYPKATSIANFDFGLAIGFTFMAGGWVTQWVSGGMLNPAVSLGVAAADLLSNGSDSLSTEAITKMANALLVQYVAWQCAGGVLAAFLFWLVHPLLYKQDPLLVK
eukprot:s6982_g2.t1